MSMAEPTTRNARGRGSRRAGRRAAALAVVLDLAAIPFALAQTPAAVLAYVFALAGLVTGLIAVGEFGAGRQYHWSSRALATVILFVPLVNVICLIALAVLTREDRVGSSNA
jgi:hypothetical protein